jgi:DNA replication licensing factor MCM6
MIRLSEAIAKANCVSEITPEFVKEAYNLLRQSIISVEKDDVDVEDEDDEAMIAAAAAVEAADGDATMDDAPQADDDRARTASRTPAPAAAAAREKTKITHDKYVAMRNAFVKRVNDDQASTEDGVEEEELLVWYLEQKESELETQEDLNNERVLAKKVLRKVCKVFSLPFIQLWYTS